MSKCVSKHAKHRAPCMAAMRSIPVCKEVMRTDWPLQPPSAQVWTVQAALGMLSRMLHCKPGTLGIAGTKDKRSVSAQHLTAWQVCSAASHS